MTNQKSENKRLWVVVIILALLFTGTFFWAITKISNAKECSRDVRDMIVPQMSNMISLLRTDPTWNPINSLETTTTNLNMELNRCLHNP